MLKFKLRSSVPGSGPGLGQKQPEEVRLWQLRCTRKKPEPTREASHHYWEAHEEKGGTIIRTYSPMSAPRQEYTTNRSSGGQAQVTAIILGSRGGHCLPLPDPWAQARSHPCWSIRATTADDTWNSASGSQDTSSLTKRTQTAPVTSTSMSGSQDLPPHLQGHRELPPLGILPAGHRTDP